MAAVDVTISGVLYDVLNRTQQRVVLIGEGSLTGLGVGGGPMPPGQGGGGSPPGIWGPTDPRPSNPISGIPGLPGAPGQQPGGIWGPGDNRPGNPISGIPGIPGYEPPQLPEPPELPPNADKGELVKPPPEGGGGWGYTAGYGWSFFPSSSQSGPKA